MHPMQTNVDDQNPVDDKAKLRKEHTHKVSAQESPPGLATRGAFLSQRESKLKVVHHVLKGQYDVRICILRNAECRIGDLSIARCEAHQQR